MLIFKGCSLKFHDFRCLQEEDDDDESDDEEDWISSPKKPVQPMNQEKITPTKGPFFGWNFTMEPETQEGIFEVFFALLQVFFSKW